MESQNSSPRKSVTFKVTKYFLIVLLSLQLLGTFIFLIFGLSFIKQLKHDNNYEEKQQNITSNYDLYIYSDGNNNSTFKISENYIKQTIGSVLMESTIVLIGLIGIIKENYYMVVIFAAIVTMGIVITCIITPLTMTVSVTVITVILLILEPTYLMVYLLAMQRNNVNVITNPIFESSSIEYKMDAKIRNF
jgi:hypothetical protein